MAWVLGVRETRKCLIRNNLVFDRPDMVWHRSVDGSNRVDLITPDWVSIEGNEAGCQSCLNYTAQGQGVSTTIAPNRPMVDIKAGEHRIAIVGWLEGFAADDAVIRIIAKRGKTWPEAGTIDVNFYFTGAQDRPPKQRLRTPIFGRVSTGSTSSTDRWVSALVR